MKRNKRIEELEAQGWYGIRWLDEYDLDVYNAVGDLYCDGKKTITATDIYKRMTGGTRAPSSGQEADIVCSMEKMRTSIVDFETTDGDFREQFPFASGQLVPCSQVTYRRGDEEFNEFTILDVPPLYAYNIIMEQYRRDCDKRFEK